MSSASSLMVLLGLSISLLVILIAKFKAHASLALIFCSLALAIATGIPMNKLVSTVEKGIGDRLAFLALIMGLGAILGKMLDDSGGAERIARTLLDKAGTHNGPCVMAVIGFLVGIPVFSDIGILLMVPLVAVRAQNAGISKFRIAVPLLVSLHVIHCIVPPHPAATAVNAILGADIGSVIMQGMLMAIPCVIARMLYISLVFGKERLPLVQLESAAGVRMGDDELPGFGITLCTVLLPLFIMVSKTLLLLSLPPDSFYRPFVEFVGNPFTALLISVCFAFWSLGLARRRTLSDLANLTSDGYRQIANVMLIIASGSAFNAVITASGISDVLGQTLGDYRSARSYWLSFSLECLTWLWDPQQWQCSERPGSFPLCYTPTPASTPLP